MQHVSLNMIVNTFKLGPVLMLKFITKSCLVSEYTADTMPTARPRFSMDMRAIITFKWQNEVTVQMPDFDALDHVYPLHVT